MSEEMVTVNMTVNGENVTKTIPVRTHLVDFVRTELGFTGSHLGCEHGVCGACTVIVDGAAIRSCLMFAVQAAGTEITTVEGLADGDELSVLQQAFHDNFALQCGFCTPGFLTTAETILKENPSPTRAEVQSAISGNICRCTGYVPIIDAILEAADRRRKGEK